ncbi:MAG: STAS domain-containing protein [Phycisphaerae bacterium]|jgi:anti-sigma B factor antagonist|nr:STAS domain-containing protein [Phycisphaerae bacterium]
MPVPLTITSSNFEEGVTLALAGEIDLARSPDLRVRLREEVDLRPKRLVIDLSRVTYMDSSGVATLVEALQRSKAGGTKLLLCGLQPKVRSIFTISRLDTVFEITQGPDEARSK